ncbi:putative reverse transcriptase domain-containing protein [Tanacetum coccineum]|uniref:Reverse transcriptase domain-containing protein n=1 Tax=Tanacetum coccineum TaxID=301880 RepID=A0ABQ5CFG2_9ASTR
MADHLRPMEELLRIPIVGIENVIVVPAVLASEFELKTELLDFISNNPFFGLENDDPHSHIKRFYQITRTFKINLVPHDVVKLILFPFSLKGAAETWLENEPPNSITTWDDLVSKFLNRFYPHSKTRELKKEITNFQQVFGETFTEAWERFKDLLRKCPHHGFSPLHQIDFFYNGLSQSDQDSLNTAAGGNLMSRNTQEALTIIENKAKSTPLVPPSETPPLSTPKPKGNLEPNPHQPPIPCPSQLQEEKFHALENLTGRADHFVYRIDIVDSLCDKFPIKNNSLSGNPTPSSDFMVESLSPFPIPYEDSDSLVEDTDTLLSHFDNSSPEYETFSFDIKEKSSGSTTTHSDFSLPEYDSFIFDLFLNRFLMPIGIDPGEFTSVVEKNIFDLSLTKDSTSIELNDFPLLLSDCDSSLSKEFSKIDLLVSFPFGNEDIIFDPGIFIIKGVQSERFHILPLDDFYSISFVSAPLFLTDPPEIETFLSFLAGNKDKVFDPGIFFINGVFSFTRKTPHLLNDNFLIDKCHSFSEISLMTESSVSFHPKDKEIRGKSS